MLCLESKLEIFSLLVLLITAGAIAGLTAGLFGNGGGFAIVPALVFLFSVLEFQSENLQHAKYPDSMYELSRVFFELGELDSANKLLTKMIEKFPTHNLYNKAKKMLAELEELVIDS